MRSNYSYPIEMGMFMKRHHLDEVENELKEMKKVVVDAVGYDAVKFISNSDEGIEVDLSIYYDDLNFNLDVATYCLETGLNLYNIKTEDDIEYLVNFLNMFEEKLSFKVYGYIREEIEETTRTVVDSYLEIHIMVPEKPIFKERPIGE